MLFLNSGALLAGAGAVGFYLQSSQADAAPFTTPLLLTAAACLGVATWLSMARGVAMRVGAGGVAFEKADLIRVPWHALESVAIEGKCARVRGQSVLGAPVDEMCNLHTYRGAVAALVAESAVRVPHVLQGKIRETVGAPLPAAGELLPLEPVQLAGRRCAHSGKTIAFESDGSLCKRCERIYLRTAKPALCACGAALD